MKLRHLCIAALTSILFLGSHVSADITTSTAEPTADILLDQFHFGGTMPTNGRVSTDIDTNARGSFFSLDTNALTGPNAPGEASVSAAGVLAQIQSLTIQRDGDVVGATSVDVVFFSGTPTEMFDGTAATAANFATDTGITVLSNTNKAFPAGTASGDFLTFNVDPFIVNTSDNLGVLVFTNGGNLGHFEGQGAGGGRLTFAGTALAGPSGSRDFNFLIGGQVIPEPTSAALLGLGAFGLIARRRRS